MTDRAVGRETCEVERVGSPSRPRTPFSSWTMLSSRTPAVDPPRELVCAGQRALDGTHRRPASDASNSGSTSGSPWLSGRCATYGSSGLSSVVTRAYAVRRGRASRAAARRQGRSASCSRPSARRSTPPQLDHPAAFVAGRSTSASRRRHADPSRRRRSPPARGCRRRARARRRARLGEQVVGGCVPRRASGNIAPACASARGEMSQSARTS